MTIVRRAQRVAATHPAWSISPRAWPPNSVPWWFVWFGMTSSASRTSAIVRDGIVRHARDGIRPAGPIARRAVHLAHVRIRQTQVAARSGRCAPRPRPAIPTAERSLINGANAQAAVSGGQRDRRVRPRLLLGRGEAVLGAARGHRHRGRLRGRLHAEPDLRGGLQRQDRPRRGRAGRVRPVAHQLRAAAEAVLGGPRPDPGHAPGQRSRHAVPIRHLHAHRCAGGGRRGVARDVPGRAVEGRLRGDHDRDPPAPEFYFAEDYHQQYLVKVPNGYCPVHATGVKLTGPIVTMEQV